MSRGRITIAAAYGSTVTSNSIRPPGLAVRIQSLLSYSYVHADSQARGGSGPVRRTSLTSSTTYVTLPSLQSRSRDLAGLSTSTVPRPRAAPVSHLARQPVSSSANFPSHAAACEREWWRSAACGGREEKRGNDARVRNPSVGTCGYCVVGRAGNRSDHRVGGEVHRSDQKQDQRNTGRSGVVCTGTALK